MYCRLHPVQQHGSYEQTIQGLTAGHAVQGCIKQAMQGDHCILSLGQQQMPGSSCRGQMCIQASTRIEHSLGRPDGGKHLGFEALLIHEGAMGAATVVQE